MDVEYLNHIGNYVADRLEKHNGCDHTLRWTREALAISLSTGSTEAAQIIQWMESYGGYCDCEMLLNVVARADSLDYTLPELASITAAIRANWIKWLNTATDDMVRRFDDDMRDLVAEYGDDRLDITPSA